MARFNFDNVLTLDDEMPYTKYKGRLIQDVIEQDPAFVLECTKGMKGQQPTTLLLDNESWGYLWECLSKKGIEDE